MRVKLQQRKEYYSIPVTCIELVKLMMELRSWISWSRKRKEALRLCLRQQLVSVKDDPTLYALYARATALAGDEVRSTEAIAESYYQRGGIQEAVAQLEKLTKRSDLDYYQRSRVDARLIELRIEMGDEDLQTKTS